MHTYIQCQNQQVNRRHMKITYLLMAPEPARGRPVAVPDAQPTVSNSQSTEGKKC